MTGPPDVLALGELLIDFTPIGDGGGGEPGWAGGGGPGPGGGEAGGGYPSFTQNPGGAPANLLVAAAPAGARAAFVGKVGDDAFGCFLAGVLRREGVSTEGLVMTREAGTTLAFVHLLPGGDRAFTFYRKPGADMTLRASDLNLGLIRSARIFHFGSLSLTHPDPRKATLLAAMTAREAGAALSFDPNYREPLWGSLAEFRERSLAFLPMADVLKVSLEEALILGGDPGGMDAAARALLARGPSLVLVTLGAGGLAHYGPGGQKGLIPAPAVEAVDTTGAGDAFLGTFLGELSRREGLPLSLKEPGDHGASLARAVAAGTLACLRKGGISSIPSREDTLAMAARIRPGP